MPPPLSSRFVAANLAVYGFAHAAVDAGSVGVLFASENVYSLSPDDFFHLILLYNILAFGTQPFWGWLIDRWKQPRRGAIAGCLIVAAGAVALGMSYNLAIVLVGLGNAIFHVGGGAISLGLTPGRATAPGIFVGPGAIGLAVGMAMGKMGLVEPWLLVALLLIPCASMSVLAPPPISYQRERADNMVAVSGLLILLLFFSIAIRSFLGLSLKFPWKNDVALLGLLTLAVAVGKGLGGVLADRYGWVRVAAGALVLSAPLLAFFAQVPALGIAGVFLLNVTMAVTLAATSQVFPGQPGFAFGLTCLALIVGALPTFTSYKSAVVNEWLVLAVIIISAATLWAALAKLTLLKNASESCHR